MVTSGRESGIAVQTLLGVSVKVFWILSFKSVDSE